MDRIMPRQNWLASVALLDECRARLLDVGEVELHLKAEQALTLLRDRELPDMAAIVLRHIIETTPMAPSVREELGLFAAIVDSFTGVEAVTDDAATTGQSTPATG